MNAMAEKLKSAGADTLGAEFTTICIEALKLHPDNVGKAWDHVGAVFGQGFLLGIMKDMGGGVKNLIPDPSSASGYRVRPLPSAPKPYVPRVIPPERLEKRRQLQEVIRSKYKNSGGTAWSDVTWHELSALKRDGAEAEALLAAISSDVPNDGRTVGDVLGIKRVDEIIDEIRSRRS